MVGSGRNGDTMIEWTVYVLHQKRYREVGVLDAVVDLGEKRWFPSETISELTFSTWIDRWTEIIKKGLPVSMRVETPDGVGRVRYSFRCFVTQVVEINGRVFQVTSRITGPTTLDNVPRLPGNVRSER